jgi:uncharacterized protein YbjT (DUF2867 family)
MKEIGLPLSVLRPVYFMENFNAPTARKIISGGRLIMALDPNKPLQMISVEDIGFIAAIMLDNPDDWKGRSIEIAGDSLTMPQVAQKFSAAPGQKVEFVEQQLQELKKVDHERYLMMTWLNGPGYQADIGAIRSIHPSLMNLDQWLEKGYWKSSEEGVPIPQRA